jgi:hypothetical protein
MPLRGTAAALDHFQRVKRCARVLGDDIGSGKTSPRLTFFS